MGATRETAGASDTDAGSVAEGITGRAAALTERVRVREARGGAADVTIGILMEAASRAPVVRRARSRAGAPASRMPESAVVPSLLLRRRLGGEERAGDRADAEHGEQHGTGESEVEAYLSLLAQGQDEHETGKGHKRGDELGWDAARPGRRTVPARHVGGQRPGVWLLTCALEPEARARRLARERAWLRVPLGWRGGGPADPGEQRPPGLAANDPVDRQAMPLLEALHRSLGQRAVQAVDRAGPVTRPPKAALHDANGVRATALW